LLRSPLWKYPESWSPDGRLILFTQLDPKSRTDLWLLPMDGGKPIPFVVTDGDEAQGRFSPDGRWVAYSANETGRAEVYVRAFPLADARWQISTDGGVNPAWRGDGREIFFLSPDNHMMSAAVKDTSGGFDAEPAKPLFQSPRIRRGAGGIIGGDRYYAVTPRGDRFLINRVTSDMRASTITVLLDR
jgi:eukaryotic-like serine/threonine-protein kinase